MNIILIPAIAIAVAIVGGRIITKIKEDLNKDKKDANIEHKPNSETPSN